MKGRQVLPLAGRLVPLAGVEVPDDLSELVRDHAAAHRPLCPGFQIGNEGDCLLLPFDHQDALLIGRLWDPQTEGPRVVSVRGEEVFDLTPAVDIFLELMERDGPAGMVLKARQKCAVP
jgi:hypothetical protein